MPKKDKTRAKKAQTALESRTLLFKEDGQEYAKVVKEFGGNRLSLECEDGKKRIGIIRGNMRNRARILLNDIVLVSTREYEDDRADIFHKYTDSETRKLKKAGVIPLISKDHQENDSNNQDENGPTQDDQPFVFEDL